MAELNGQGGELRFSIEIKRKATGKTEKYELIGKVNGDGCHTQHSGPERRD
jgi:hypothetical protein